MFLSNNNVINLNNVLIFNFGFNIRKFLGRIKEFFIFVGLFRILKKINIFIKGISEIDNDFEDRVDI